MNRCPENACATTSISGESCVKCGKPMPEPCPSPEQIARFFAELREYVRAARPQYAELAFDGFQRAATERLARGAEEYGERNFLRDGVDPAGEAIEEAADGPNWILGAMARDPERWTSPKLWEAAYHFTQAHRALAEAQHEDQDG